MRNVSHRLRHLNTGPQLEVLSGDVTGREYIPGRQTLSKSLHHFQWTLSDSVWGREGNGGEKEDRRVIRGENRFPVR